MTVVAREQELVRACQILFGLRLNVGREFLEYLQPSGIRKAFRKRARETHPDTGVEAPGDKPGRGADLFREVHEAYRILNRYLEARERGFRLPRPSGGTGAKRQAPLRSASPGRHHQGPDRPARYRGHQGPARPATEAKPPAAETRAYQPPRRRRVEEHFFSGPIPKRRLLFGTFLYYSGAISWQGLNRALVWQRTHRPRLGELGRHRGWLSEHDIRKVLRCAGPDRRFGECAVDLGLLTDSQLRSIVEQQRQLNSRLGRFFEEEGTFTAEQLYALAAKHRIHNTRTEAAVSAANRV